ncbi:hypothetical protein BDF19DRAFT_432470 [Syncephalis fuscata]|nr:hypothetical protein BDF19DRAFT_432470 [Syncephalis fuscata]
MATPGTDQVDKSLYDDPESSGRLEFQRGDLVQLECLVNYTSDVEPTWQPLPPCIETHKPPTFEYAVDDTLICTWLMDIKMMAYMAKVTRGPEMISCRLPVNRLDTDRHVAFPLLFKGHVANKSLHLTNNLHMIFHAQKGQILGGSGYPVHEKWEVPELNEFYSIMMPVKWFDGHGFLTPFTTQEELYQPTGITRDGYITPRLAFFLCLFTLLLTSTVLIGIYTGYLRDAVFDEGRRSADKKKKKE